jgi:hypothetical protein
VIEMFRTALVVTEDLAELARLTDWLESAGFTPVACAGPRLRDRCPRQEGKSCLLRDAVEVAVVVVPAGNGSEHPGDRPELRCTALPDNGTTIFITSSGIEVTVRGQRQSLGTLSRQSLVDLAEFVRARGEHPSGLRGRAKAQRPADATG